MKYKILLLNDKKKLKKCTKIIRKSFITVANDFNLTKNNSPSNPAFITLKKILNHINEKPVEYFGLYIKQKKLIGSVALEKAENGIYYLERLAVLPEYRHKGYGENLLDFSFRYVSENEGKKISIGIMDQNKILKEWYIKNGFKETAVKKFDHIPFTVCFMDKKIS